MARVPQCLCSSSPFISVSLKKKKQSSKENNTNPDTQDKRSSNILIGGRVHSTDYKVYCKKMAFDCETLSPTWCSYCHFALAKLSQTYRRSPIIQPTPFENIDLCLNRARNALVILAFRELLHLFMTNKGLCTKTVNRHIIKGTPRADRFAISTDVRCKSPG